MALLIRRRSFVAALAGIAALAVCPAVMAQPHEHEVRAAFLYNFTKFIEWPMPHGEKTADPFRMCVVADRGFVGIVESLVHGESTGGRPLVVSTPGTAQAARACHLLYIGRAEADAGARLLAAVRDLPVLTVGDSPQFLDDGGAIRFVLDRRRVRFDISLQAIDRARLRVSSNLLRVARHIRQNGTAP